MESIGKKIKLVEELPIHLPYARRIRALQRTIGREVEFRVPPERCPPAAIKLFQIEERELTVLDHPAFLPILDRGVTRNRPFYMVPLRTHPRLAERMKDPEFTLAERCLAARSIADGMAAFHLIGGVLGELSPWLLAWNQREQRCYFLHHRVPTKTPETNGSDPVFLPDDLASEKEATPSSDLYRWGWLAYTLISDGEDPYTPDSGEFTPIRTRVPQLTRDLAHAIEACLARVPAARPGNAAELDAVLKSSLDNLLEDPVEDLEASAVLPIESVQQSIQKLRSQDKIPEPRKMNFQASVADDVLEARPISAFHVAAIAVLVLVLLGETYRLVRPTRPATSSTGMHETFESDDSGLVRLAPSTQASYRQNPQLMSLVSRRKITAASFSKTWKILRHLCLSGKLPAQVNDADRIAALSESFERDPEGACQDLEALIEELRVVLDLDESAN